MTFYVLSSFCDISELLSRIAWVRHSYLIAVTIRSIICLQLQQNQICKSFPTEKSDLACSANNAINCNFFPPSFLAEPWITVPIKALSTFRVHLGDRAWRGGEHVAGVERPQLWESWDELCWAAEHRGGAAAAAKIRWQEIGQGSGTGVRLQRGSKVREPSFFLCR